MKKKVFFIAALMILTSSTIYAEQLKEEHQISKKENKAVLDEEIKWLWPFSNKNYASNGGSSGGEDIKPDPPNDNIPSTFDPNGKEKNGEEDIYTEILERKWDKEQGKWVVVGLKDTNKDGIADIYDPEGDFDGDGTINKEDKDWTMNNVTPNKKYFESASVLGYVDVSELLKMIKNNSFDTYKLDDVLYHDHKTPYEAGRTIYKNHITDENKLNEYNEAYNKISTDTTDPTSQVVTSFKNNDKMIEKLTKIGEVDGKNHADKYNGFTQQTGEIVFNGVDSTMSETQKLETTSSGNVILVNKRKIEANDYAQKLIGSADKGEIYNYGVLNSGQYSELKNSTLYNYGLISKDNTSATNGYAYLQYINNTNGAVSGAIYNYGVLNGENNKYALYGQYANVASTSSKIDLFNYGDINLKTKNNNITGQYNKYGDIFNFGKIKISAERNNENDTSSERSYKGQNIANGTGNLYNYGEIDISYQSKYTSMNTIVGQYIDNGTSSAFNYGKITINGENSNIRSISGIYVNGENTKGYNYGTIEQTGGIFAINPRPDIPSAIYGIRTQAMTAIYGGEIYKWKSFRWNVFNVV